MPVVPAIPAFRIRALRWGIVVRRVRVKVEMLRREVSSRVRGWRWIRGDAEGEKVAMWERREVSVEWDLVRVRVVKRRVRWEEGGWVVRKSLMRRWQIPRPRPLGERLVGLDGKGGDGGAYTLAPVTRM